MLSRLVLAGSLLAALTLSVHDAEACGGCLYPGPPTEADAGSTTQNPTVVTDHRMVVALTAQATTLWDQLEYAGDPEEFAWVLPIRGAVVVGLGSDAFIDSLDKQTAPTILGPRVSCNAPPMSGGGPSNFSEGGGSSGFGCGCYGMSASDESASFAPTYDAGAAFDGSNEPPDEGVVITERSVVGPYDTVQIHGDDTESILGWLRRNKFVIPAEVEPILTKYVAEKFDFLAVRLRPGVGVHAMKPIRVSWKGATPMLPLRMVAAGVASSVGVKLFVIGDGRWTTKNFPAFTLPDDELLWDFKASRSNYTALRSSKAKALDDRGFALESSLDIYVSTLPTSDPEPLPADGGSTDAAKEASPSDTSAETSDAAEDAADAATDAVVSDAAPETSDSGAPAVPPGANDVEIAFAGKSSRRVTRLRADLPVRHLNADLELEADVDQSIVGTRRALSRQTGADALCPYGVASVRPASFTPDTAPTPGEVPATAECTLTTSSVPASSLPIGFFAALSLGGLVRRLRSRGR